MRRGDCTFLSRSFTCRHPIAMHSLFEMSIVLMADNPIAPWIFTEDGVTFNQLGIDLLALHQVTFEMMHLTRRYTLGSSYTRVLPSIHTYILMEQLCHYPVVIYFSFERSYVVQVRSVQRASCELRIIHSH